MAINNEDVKLFESQRLTDEEDGGGRVTGNEVINGIVNNLFQDISRIDRTIGDVALRKAFIGISTDNNDPYLGSHLILTEPPKDKSVSVLLFDTESHTDERSDARDRIESYVIPGIKAPFELVGNQLKGQRTIVVYQREEQKLPEIGEVYKLTDSDDVTTQFIRVTEVSYQLVTYTYNNGTQYVDFERRQVELTLSASLEANFTGAEPVPSAPEEATSLIQGTQIADSSRYYGIKPVSADISAGDLTVNVESIYTPLVPSAKKETPLLDQSSSSSGKSMVATSDNDRSLSMSFVHVSGNQSRAYLQRGALPKSITLSIDSSTYSDDGAGAFVHK